jgi:hypothetical protein
MSGLTIESLNNMPADEYRENLKDPQFAEAVTRLNNQAVSALAPVPEVVASTPVEVAAIPEVVAPTPVEQRYEYQPTDEQGRPMGGKQVIKYTTQDELTTRLVEQNSQILRQLRKVNRNARLGITEAESIPDSAQRFDMNLLELKPKDLNVDERFQLTQDLNDPEKFVAARDKLVESALGISGADLAKALNEQKLATLQVMAKQNFDIFVEGSNGFYDDNDNRKTLTDWMFKNKLAPTVENFTTAFSSLTSAGLLNEAPVVRPEPVPVVEPAPKPQEPVVAEVRIDPTPQPQAKRQSQVPSGLNERVSSAAGPVSVDGPSVTLADIDRMTPDEYKAKMKNPAFIKLVNDLEQAALLRRRQRLGQV